MPEIKVERMIFVENVRKLCVKENLYTNGTIKEYEAMLGKVDEIKEPTTENLYIIAKDICEHSEDKSISNIIFLLANKAVFTFYEIEGEE